MFDTDIFFDDFAEIANVGRGKIKAIFDRPSVQYFDGPGVITTHTPQLTCQTTDVVKFAIEQDSAITFRGKAYLVSDIDDDGTGISVLKLRQE